ncbi:MAG: hypothetical protein IPJ89_00465 [Candidatus Iainarchaeum archaeon]|uniref:Uncharacterized protein n=1 Tax=Candidatus Iainarchaeum sp. TaxID=3101447 RepID=A0A7T9I168_9ARCH|nr:MAG: hypothetical protein IPJ89_00465 [Candidatus Diapherotrites archaeon]
MHTKSWKALVLFVISYVVLYLLYATQEFLPKWDIFGYSFLRGDPITGYAFIDPLFLFIPFIGFWLMWLGLEWYEHHFKDEFVLNVPFALLYMVAAYAVWFVAMLGYYWNNAYLVEIARGGKNAASASFAATLAFVQEQFIPQLLQSPFFVFVLAGLLGWVSYLLVRRFWGEKHMHVAA